MKIQLYSTQLKHRQFLAKASLAIFGTVDPLRSYFNGAQSRKTTSSGAQVTVRVTDPQRRACLNEARSHSPRATIAFDIRQ